MDDKRLNLLQRVWRRMVPVQADFFTLLSNQSALVTETIRNLEYYMSTGDKAVAALLTQEEHLADTAKHEAMHELNQAFSTPLDREDIYRAIEALDSIITHCKSTVNEMVDLEVAPDDAMQQMSQELLLGCRALETGFTELKTNPEQAETQAHLARRAHRHVERQYRHSLMQLFQGDVTVEMLKKREIYHHLIDGSRHVRAAANVLEDIVVKTF